MAPASLRAAASRRRRDAAPKTQRPVGEDAQRRRHGSNTSDRSVRLAALAAHATDAEEGVDAARRLKLRRAARDPLGGWVRATAAPSATRLSGQSQAPSPLPGSGGGGGGGPTGRRTRAHTVARGRPASPRKT